MKIEKLTENKIRIIINETDLKEKNIDIDKIISTPFETHDFLLKILIKAEKEYDFKTEGYKLLIEAFSLSDNILVFTITKYKPQSIDISKKKKLIIKRKTFNRFDKEFVYKFSNFNQFCNYCNCIKKTKTLDSKKISKNTSLYLYNDTYYLVLSCMNLNYNIIEMFYLITSEFAVPLSPSKGFSSKLSEHGKAIMRSDAIGKGIKYFCN